MWIVLSAGWMLVGVLSVVGMLVWMPRMMAGAIAAAPQGQGGPPPGFMQMVTVITTAVVAVFMIALPLAIAAWKFRK